MPGGVQKVMDERLYVSKANGDGILRRETWVDGRGRIVRYNLAYINPSMYTGDNGRVLGYDSAHGRHHRHYKGRVAPTILNSFEKIEAAFQKEWTALVKEVKRAKG